MSYIKRICVFCASSERCNQEYFNAASLLGSLIAKAGKEIIYGGGNIGMMNKLANSALKENGVVIGVIPNILDRYELGHKDITELRIVNNMHEREAMMMTESDCIIALPGGVGTFSELTQAITWKKLCIINSPIIIVNLNNFFDPLIQLYKNAIDNKFLLKDDINLWTVVDTVEDAVFMIDNNLPNKISTTIFG